MERQEPTLDVADVDPEPLTQVRRWLDEELDAADDAVPVLAAALATATTDAVPSVRFVLIRGVDADGFRFYTNRDSRKGRELASNPQAAIAVYWPRLGRQVRVEGTVSELPPAESAAYFATRPAGSRLAAWASPQSAIVEDRGSLERRFAEAAARFPGDEVPLPPFWGGYLLAPHVVELWQNRANRLHDRVRYRRPRPGDAATAPWIIERLAP